MVKTFAWFGVQWVLPALLLGDALWTYRHDCHGSTGRWIVVKVAGLEVDRYWATNVPVWGVGEPVLTVGGYVVKQSCVTNWTAPCWNGDYPFGPIVTQRNNER